MAKSKGKGKKYLVTRYLIKNSTSSLRREWKQKSKARVCPIYSISTNVTCFQYNAIYRETVVVVSRKCFLFNVFYWIEKTAINMHMIHRCYDDLIIHNSTFVNEQLHLNFPPPIIITAFRLTQCIHLNTKVISISWELNDSRW